MSCLGRAFAHAPFSVTQKLFLRGIYEDSQRKKPQKKAERNKQSGESEHAEILQYPFVIQQDRIKGLSYNFELMNKTNPSHPADSDWPCILRFKEGDESAFSEIFNKHKTTVINLAFRVVREKGAAEDIAQEVFIKIYEKRIPFDPKAKFSTWLYRVTVNTSIDFLRRKKVFPSSSDESRQDSVDPSQVSTHNLLADKELKGQIQREIDQLPEKLKIPLTLYQFEDMPYREIAKILGISEKAVERRLYRAKELLRAKFLKCL